MMYMSAVLRGALSVTVESVRAYSIYVLFSKQHQSRLPEAIINDVT